MQRFQRIRLRDKDDSRDRDRINPVPTLAMLAACSAVFLTALDQTVVVTALPKIIVDLSISPEQLDRAAWIVSGYLLGFIIAMPLMGRISDMYGRRAVFLICLGIFAFGSLFCGLATNLGNTVDISFLQHIGINVSAPNDFSDPNALSPSLVWLVSARFVQAIGGGALIPVAMAIAGDFYGEKQRGLALGLIGMVTETGGVLGPLYGAVIVQTLGWQAIFYLNLPIVAILAFAVWRLIPSGAGYQPATQVGAIYRAPTNRGRIDFLGTLLLGASLLCLSLGLSQEAITATTGVPNPNQSPIQNNPWLIGASLLLLAAFIGLELFIERRGAIYRAHVRREGNAETAGRAAPRLRKQVLPIVELSVFLRAAFSASSLVSLLVGGALISAMVDIPFFIITVVGGDPLYAGLALLRLTALIPVGAIVGGLLCPRITCRATAVIGLLLTALGFMLMHLWPIDVNWIEITTSTVICGFGFGLVIAPIGTTAINTVSNSQMGMASSVVTVLRMVGMIIGLAALTSWGLGRFHAIIVTFKPPAGVSPFSKAFQDALAKFGTSAGHDVYTSIFLAAGILCLVAIIPALLLEGKKSSPYAVLGTS
ncbi:MAG TPA: MFS transporter [Ktedonobacteraceae bacterium]|nr:MFS transporter [Ktedonobacteraceae bacterium]